MDKEKTEYLQSLQEEKGKVDDALENTKRLLAEEIDRVQSGRDKDKYVEVHQGKPTKMRIKVLIPLKEFPKYNFVGKLLGPKGSTLKQLQEETGTKMAVLGKGSVRDKKKEEDMRKEGGKYAHLNEELHVQVEAFGHPVENYRRFSVAVGELQRFLVPDDNDDIRQQQMQDMMYLNGEKPQVQPLQQVARGRGRGRGAPSPRGGNVGAPRGGGVTGLLGSAPPMGRPVPPPASARGAPSRGGGGVRGGGIRGGRGGQPARAPPMQMNVQPRQPPPQQQPQAYEEEYYGAGAYEEQTFTNYAEQEYADPYDQTATAGAGDTQCFDYGHGAGGAREQSYEDYGEQQWGNGKSAFGKAPMPPRGRGGMAGGMGGGMTGRGGMAERAHPYGGAPRQPRY